MRRTAGTTRSRQVVSGSHPGAAGRLGLGEGASDDRRRSPRSRPAAALVLAQLLDDADLAVGQQLSSLDGLGLGRAEPGGPARQPLAQRPHASKPAGSSSHSAAGRDGSMSGQAVPDEVEGHRNSRAPRSRVVSTRAARLESRRTSIGPGDAARRPGSCRAAPSASSPSRARDQPAELEPADRLGAGRRAARPGRRCRRARPAQRPGRRRARDSAARRRRAHPRLRRPARARAARAGSAPSPRISEVRATTTSGQTASAAVSAAAFAAPYARDRIGWRRLGVEAVGAGEDDVAGDQHEPGAVPRGRGRDVGRAGGRDVPVGLDVGGVDDRVRAVQGDQRRRRPRRSRRSASADPTATTSCALAAATTWRPR